MNINVTVHTYCQYCDAVIETYTFMELSEFSELQKNPETCYVNDQGEYFYNQIGACKHHDLEI